MKNTEIIEALEAHGYQFSSDSESDSGKSYFDEEYFSVRPPINKVNLSTVIIVDDCGDKTFLRSYINEGPNIHFNNQHVGEEFKETSQNNEASFLRIKGFSNAVVNNTHEELHHPSHVSDEFPSTCSSSERLQNKNLTTERNEAHKKQEFLRLSNQFYPKFSNTPVPHNENKTITVQPVEVQLTNHICEDDDYLFNENASRISAYTEDSDTDLNEIQSNTCLCCSIQ